MSNLTVQTLIKRRVKPAFGAIMSGLFLSACATSNITGQWDCPALQGEACTSIEEADKRYGDDRGTPLSTPSPGGKVAGEAPVQASPALSGGKGTNRTDEITARVWIYPFVDDSDNYHEGGYVHMVVYPPTWQTNPDHMFPVKPRAAGQGTSVSAAPETPVSRRADVPGMKLSNTDLPEVASPETNTTPAKALVNVPVNTPASAVPTNVLTKAPTNAPANTALKNPLANASLVSHGSERLVHPDPYEEDK